MTKKQDIAASAGPSEVQAKSSAAEIEAFLNKAGEVALEAGRGRLIFALDATMSRQPTWDLACKLQAGMFEAANVTGSLTVQLAYFRGFGECRASPWVSDARALRDLMVRIDCRGGQTQIRKVLAHARREAEKRPVAALVFVGDAMEEDADHLCSLAGELGLLGVRAFMFHEGRNPAAEQAFREIARLTRGVYLPFNAAAADELRSLLAAVATFAAGGLKALASSRTAGAAALLPKLR